MPVLIFGGGGGTSSSGPFSGSNGSQKSFMHNAFMLLPAVYMVYNVYGLQCIWFTMYMVYNVYGLQCIWFTMYMVYNVYGRGAWSGRVLTCISGVCTFGCGSR